MRIWKLTGNQHYKIRITEYITKQETSDNIKNRENVDSSARKQSSRWGSSCMTWEGFVELWFTVTCRLVVKEMCLEVKPVWRYIAAEWTLLTVSGGVAATMHIEQRAVAEHRTTCAYERHLSLTQISQDLLVGEVVQQMHEVCLGIVTTAGSSVGHWHTLMSVWKHTPTHTVTSSFPTLRNVPTMCWLVYLSLNCYLISFTHYYYFKLPKASRRPYILLLCFLIFLLDL